MTDEDTKKMCVKCTRYKYLDEFKELSETKLSKTCVICLAKARASRAAPKREKKPPLPEPHEVPHGLKICYNCKTCKPIAEFGKRKVCHQCNEKRKAWRLKPKTRVIESEENLIECECGSKFLRSGIKRHQMTNKHSKFMYEKSKD